MTARSLAPLLAALVLLCACAELPLPVSDAAQAAELLAYWSRVARLPAAKQSAELVEAAKRFGREGTVYARLRLGGLYAQPDAGLRDDARALALLEPLAAAGRGRASSPIEQLAALVYTQVAARQRIVHEEGRKQEALRQRIEEEGRKQEALRQRIEEEARKQGALRQRIEEEARKQGALRQRIEEEARKQEALRERIEALKSIERSIIEREERLPERPR